MNRTAMRGKGMMRYAQAKVMLCRRMFVNPAMRSSVHGLAGSPREGNCLTDETVGDESAR